MSEELDLTWQQENRSKWPSWKQSLLVAIGVQVAGLVLGFLGGVVSMLVGIEPNLTLVTIAISIALLGGVWIWKNGFWVLAVMGWNVLFNILLAIGSALVK